MPDINVEDFSLEACDVQPMPMMSITEEHLTEVCKVAFPTGSRVLGGVTSDSDYDYVLTELEYKHLVQAYDIPHSQPFAYINYPSKSVKYLCGDKIINLIVTISDEVKQAWIKTTHDYLELVNVNIPISKDLRVAIFSYFRTINGI